MESLWEDSPNSSLDSQIELTDDELNDIMNSTITIDTSLSGYGSTGSYNPSFVSINSTASMGSVLGAGTISNSFWNGTTAVTPLKVTGTAEFEGDVVVKGRNLMESLDAIEKRLAILVPDPAKLEHFEALKKAYDHYKMLEAMCQLPSTKNDK